MQSVGFSRPEYRVVSLPLLWDLPNPDIEAGSPALHANCLPYEPRILFVFFPLVHSYYYWSSVHFSSVVSDSAAP